MLWRMPHSFQLLLFLPFAFYDISSIYQHSFLPKLDFEQHRPDFDHGPCQPRKLFDPTDLTHRLLHHLDWWHFQPVLVPKADRILNLNQNRLSQPLPSIQVRPALPSIKINLFADSTWNEYENYHVKWTIWNDPYKFTYIHGVTTVFSDSIWEPKK